MTAPWRSLSSQRGPGETPEPAAASTIAADDSFARSYAPGDIIANKYELRRKIAQGGMGAVWVAVNRVLQSEVALKLLRPELASDTAAERLLREARAAAQLQHPSIVRVFDFGVTDRGDPFLVMELLEGESLARLLARERKLTGVLAVQMILPVLDGLGVAHTRGVVHRDLKPDNIVLARDDTGAIRPKVLDFGIAKIASTTLPEAERKLTRMGTVLGSPEYMSPEQARGVAEIDARTDVWSISVVLYEMLTGDVPFRAPNYHALMVAIVERPMPPLDGVDRALAAIVARGLDKDRETRWGSVRLLGYALARWLFAAGVTEDISASSLRASWLAPGVSVPPMPSFASAAMPRDAETLLAPATGDPILPPPARGPAEQSFGSSDSSAARSASMGPGPMGSSGYVNLGAMTGEGAAHEVAPESGDYFLEQAKQSGQRAKWFGAVVAIAAVAGIGALAWRSSLLASGRPSVPVVAPAASHDSAPSVPSRASAEVIAPSSTALASAPSAPASAAARPVVAPTGAKPIAAQPPKASHAPVGHVNTPIESPAQPAPHFEPPPAKRPNDLGF